MALFFHSVVSSPSLLRNKQITSVSRLMSLSRVGTTVTAFKVQPSVLPLAAMEKIAEVVDLGELFADRARVRDDPGMRARSRRTIWNRARLRRTVCDRARHGLASGVHRDKESFPNAKVQKPNWGTSPKRSTTPIVPMRRRPRFSRMCETVQCEH